MTSIDERVAKLESFVFGTVRRDVRENDWQASVGTVTDDAMSTEIIDGALLLREAERLRASQETGQDVQ